MNIARQVIDNQARNLVADMPEWFLDYKDDNHKVTSAFIVLGVSSYLGIDIESAYNYLTDGPDDGGIDAAYIDNVGGNLNVILFQAKYSMNLDKEAAFPENSIEKSASVIKSIFDPRIKLTLNEKSQAVVDEIHSLLYSGEIPQVTFVCMNNGIRWNSKGQEIIEREFHGQHQVSFDYYNCDDMVNSNNNEIKEEVYLHLIGTGIHEDFNYKSLIIGKVSVDEIGNLMSTYGDQLLQRNIRYYLGSSKVNNQIRDTLLDKEDRGNFFFYNNGITITCDQFSANYLQKENWIVKLKNMQIINGGQTCKIIDMVLNEHLQTNVDNAYVLVRIYQLDSSDVEMIRRITLATNSQNAVDLRDLRANDDSQQLLVKGTNELGYTYKPKRDGSLKNDPKVIPSSVCAEAVFTVWRKRPFLAKYHKSELFDKYYEEIFGKENGVLNAAQMILAVRIFRYCDAKRKRDSDDNNDIMIIRRYSSYLSATLIGEILLKSMNLHRVEDITHLNYSEAEKFFEVNKEKMLDEAETIIVDKLQSYFSYLGKGLRELDGRTIASAFRNEEFCGSCMTAIAEGGMDQK